jgi:hypothetical protein
MLRGLRGDTMSDGTIPRRQAILGLGLAGIGGLVGRAAAQDPVLAPQPTLELSLLPGTVGLLEGQAARLSIVHHHHGKDIPPICNIVADIIGADGKSLASQKFTDLKPMEARFVDFLHPGAPGKPVNSRIELFGVLRYTPGHEIGASLEVLNVSRGQSHQGVRAWGIEDPALGNQQGAPATVPVLPPGTVSFLRGQFLRISMVHHSNDALPPVCNIVADVFDALGNLFATRKFANPGADETLLFDVPHPGGKGPHRDTRIEVSVHIRHTPGHEVGASVQVVDLSSGGTLLIPPTCNIQDSTL